MNGVVREIPPVVPPSSPLMLANETKRDLRPCPIPLLGIWCVNEPCYGRKRSVWGERRLLGGSDSSLIVPLRREGVGNLFRALDWCDDAH